MLKTSDQAAKSSEFQSVSLSSLADSELGSALGPEMPALVTGNGQWRANA